MMAGLLGPENARRSGESATDLSMNVTFACPNCQQPSRTSFREDTKELVCPHCQQTIVVPSGAIQGGRIERCLVCPSTDLYVRKDMPQRLGVGIVVTGIVASSIAWAYHHPLWAFGILFATAVIDFVLFFLIGSALMCYRCQAQYRGVENLDSHAPFDLEVHEKYRQMQARLSQ